MVEFAVEKYAQIMDEMELLLRRHWEEVALNRDAVPLDIDRDKYLALEDQGVLHIITARDGSKLVGYHVAMIANHLHYKTTLHGITDVYFLAPEYRYGGIGYKMIAKVEEEMKALGVKKLFTAVKLHLDHGPLFEALGYKPVERLYSKMI